MNQSKMNDTFSQDHEENNGFDEEFEALLSEVAEEEVSLGKNFTEGVMSQVSREDSSRVLRRMTVTGQMLRLAAVMIPLAVVFWGYMRVANEPEMTDQSAGSQLAEDLNKAMARIPNLKVPNPDSLFLNRLRFSYAMEPLSDRVDVEKYNVVGMPKISLKSSLNISSLFAEEDAATATTKEAEPRQLFTGSANRLKSTVLKALPGIPTPDLSVRKDETERS